MADTGDDNSDRGGDAAFFAFGVAGAVLRLGRNPSRRGVDDDC